MSNPNPKVGMSLCSKLRAQMVFTSLTAWCHLKRFYKAENSEYAGPVTMAGTGGAALPLEAKAGVSKVEWFQIQDDCSVVDDEDSVSEDAWLCGADAAGTTGMVAVAPGVQSLMAKSTHAENQWREEVWGLWRNLVMAGKFSQALARMGSSINVAEVMQMLGSDVAKGMQTIASIEKFEAACAPPKEDHG